MIRVSVEFTDDVRPEVQEFTDGQEHVAASWAQKMKQRADVEHVDVSAACIHPACPWCSEAPL